MALKVLIIDPDITWSEKIKDYLVDELYEVDTVINGKDAQAAIYNNNYFSVVISWSTIDYTAAQVLRYIKSNSVGLSVTVIVDDVEAFEEDNLTIPKIKKMGASEVLFKPVEVEDVFNSIECFQSYDDLVQSTEASEKPSEEEEVGHSDHDLSSIKIDEFYSTKVALFDIYIKLSENKYLKIIHTGDGLSKERIDKYKNEKKVEFLYFHNKDRKKYIKHQNHIASKVMDNKKVKSKSKIKLLKNITDKSLEEVGAEGVKPQIIMQVKELSESMYKLIEQQKDLFTYLKQLNELDPTNQSHSFLTSLYSTAIINQFYWGSQTSMEAMSLACILHDIGKTKLPSELVGVDSHDMTSEQIEIYQQHPIFSVELLEGNRTIKNSVKQIILQHHELLDGTGFPHGKRGGEIVILANILGLVDYFVHKMIRDETKPIDTIKAVLKEPGIMKKYNPSALEAFLKVFIDPNKIKKDFVLPSNSRVVNKKSS